MEGNYEKCTFFYIIHHLKRRGITGLSPRDVYDKFHTQRSSTTTLKRKIGPKAARSSLTSGDFWFAKFGIPKKFQMWPPAAWKARRINLFTQTPMENFSEKASAGAAHVNTAVRVRSSSNDRKQVPDIRWQNRQSTDKNWRQGTDDQEILYWVNSRVCENNFHTLNCIVLSR